MTTVCVAANTIHYPEGGGHLWVYLNWALGLRSAGCDVIWLEGLAADTELDDARRLVGDLQERLGAYGLADSLALCDWGPTPLPAHLVDTVGVLDTDAAAEADLLLNLAYMPNAELVARFRRSALLDIDPGLLQVWMREGSVAIPPHDVYLTIGETVGRADAPFSDLGLDWQHVLPCVALEWWPVRSPAPGAAFSTVSHWWDEWVVFDGLYFANSKRISFLQFLELPRRTCVPLELALDLEPWDEDHDRLVEAGWRLREAHSVAARPWSYQRYIQESLGEFSAAKP